ncbi:hypothetical protein QI045_00490 [Staphylococcus saprophyticus]|nr:hypothetical protein [Staphylococcus saprophyticus]
MIINLENHTVLMHEDDYSKIMQYKSERDTLIDDLSWYKAKVSRLERDNEQLKEIKQEKEQLEESFQYQLEKRLEYFTKCQELKKENTQLKEKNGELQEVIEDKNSDILFTEDENEQLKQDLLRTEELQEVYHKAKAYDLLREDIEINEKVFKQQAENDEVSAIIHGHYLALLEQSELEDK